MTRDFLGVHPSCGCITAWLSVDATEEEQGNFFRFMRDTGRDVIRGTRSQVISGPCPHQQRPVMPGWRIAAWGRMKPFRRR
jgi:hypothetical protein